MSKQRPKGETFQANERNGAKAQGKEGQLRAPDSGVLQSKNGLT